MAFGLSGWSLAFADENTSTSDNQSTESASDQADSQTAADSSIDATSYTLTFVVDSDEGAFTDTTLVTTPEQDDATLVDHAVSVEEGLSPDADAIPAVTAKNTSQKFDHWVVYDTDGVSVKATYTNEELAQATFSADTTLKAVFSDAAPASGAATLAVTPQSDSSAGVIITPQSATSIDMSTVTGDVEISLSGLKIGGVAQEASLNPDGYVLTGTTTTHIVTVDDEVATTLTLDNLSITSNHDATHSLARSCIDVSHADVTIDLVGDNSLWYSTGITSDGGPDYGPLGCAIQKDGVDHSLVIESSTGTGKLTATGDPTSFHSGTISNGYYYGSERNNDGFGYLTIKSGTVIARGGAHAPGIGAICRTTDLGNRSDGGTAKKECYDVEITGGTVYAYGGQDCSGIGSGWMSTVDGIHISGGAQVHAEGGTRSPGIGSGGSASTWTGFGTGNVSDIKITGGTTVVTALGDSGTNMPGIGVGKWGDGTTSGTLINVIASPLHPGWQGYCKSGTSATDFSFSTSDPKTPFPTDGDIGDYLQRQAEAGTNVYYTQIYFGPRKDNNQIGTKVEVGVDNTSHLTGGSGWTSDEIAALMQPTGHNSDGGTLQTSDFTVDATQLATINAAKESGQIGDWPLTYSYVDAVEGVVSVAGYVHLYGPDPAPIVTMTKTVDKTDVVPGDTLTFTITATNSGNAAAVGYWIKDYAPDNTIFVSCDSTGIYGADLAGREYTSWFITNLAPGETKTMTLTVKVKECSDDKVPIYNVAMGELTGTTTRPNFNHDPVGDRSNQVVSMIDSSHEATRLPKTGDAGGLMSILGLTAAGAGVLYLALRRRPGRDAGR